MVQSLCHHIWVSLPLKRWFHLHITSLIQPPNSIPNTISHGERASPPSVRSITKREKLSTIIMTPGIHSTLKSYFASVRAYLAIAELLDNSLVQELMGPTIRAPNERYPYQPIAEFACGKYKCQQFQAHHVVISLHTCQPALA